MTDTPEQIGRGMEVLLATLGAVDELFDDAESSITVQITNEDAEGNDLPPVDKEVNFKACKVKHIGPLTKLVQAMAMGLGDAEMIKVLDYVSGKQQAQLAAGVSAYALNTEELVNEVVVTGSLIGQLLSGASEILPHYVSIFTNLTEEEFGNIDPIQGCLVAYGIFARNFSFFTRNTPLLSRAFIAVFHQRLGKIKSEKKASV